MDEYSQLVKDTMKLYITLGHQIQAVRSTEADAVDVIIKSKNGSIWIARCDTSSEINMERVKRLFHFAREIKPARLAIFSSAHFTDNVKAFIEGKPVDLISEDKLYQYLVNAIQARKVDSSIDLNKESEPETTGNFTRQPPQPTEIDTHKQCPYCAELIKTEAIVCRYCGSDLRIPKPQIATSIQDVQPKKKARPLAFILVTLIFGVCICGAAITFFMGDEPDMTGASAIKASMKCEQIVESQLVSPATAEFASYQEQRIGTLGKESGKYDAAYRVISYVDAENGFGAFIRTNYTCDISYEGGDWTEIRNWTLLDLQTD